jgi:hypothetical protein
MGSHNSTSWSAASWSLGSSFGSPLPMKLTGSLSIQVGRACCVSSTLPAPEMAYWWLVSPRSLLDGLLHLARTRLAVIVEVVKDGLIDSCRRNCSLPRCGHVLQLIYMLPHPTALCQASPLAAASTGVEMHLERLNSFPRLCVSSALKQARTRQSQTPVCCPR